MSKVVKKRVKISITFTAQGYPEDIATLKKFLKNEYVSDQRDGLTEGAAEFCDLQEISNLKIISVVK